MYPMKKNSLSFQKPSADPEINHSRYSQRPVRALLLIFAALAVSMIFTGFVLYGILKLPMEFSDNSAFSTVIMFTVSNIFAYLFVPYFLRIPKGKRTFKEYLSDIGFTHLNPLSKLSVLTISCLFILILCQGSGSLVYRLIEGKPVSIFMDIFSLKPEAFGHQ